MCNLNEIILEPDPARVMEGLRDTGYDFNMAMADLVDNSIAANATVIKVYLNPLPNNDLKLYIVDNGCGMTMEGLMNAMRYGSNRRADASSLGKFGLGLKTASTAFCRSLSLMSRGEDRKCNKVQWDLDEIAKINKWKLLQPSISPDEQDLLDEVTDGGTGTIVIWEKIDRLLKDYQQIQAKKNAIKRILEKLKFHFSMVYQRFLDPNYTDNPIKIYLNDVEIMPWDPFCLKEKGTTEAGVKKIKAELPDGGESFFTVKAYVLPRKEDFSSVDVYNQAEINNDMQGFYVYRENRLLHQGDWAGIYRNDPHFSLIRVDLSFDHTLDDAFNVDIKKSRIHINEVIADFLGKQFLPAPRREAESRYRKYTIKDKDSGGRSVHEGPGATIDENSQKLESSKINVIDKEKGKVKVENINGEIITTIKIFPESDSGSKQKSIKIVDNLDGNILWEPAVIDGEHAVAINSSHEFYKKVFGPNITNPSVVQGLDSLLWGLAEAELSTYNTYTREQYIEMRNHVSRILNALVKYLPDPEGVN